MAKTQIISSAKVLHIEDSITDAMLVKESLRTTCEEKLSFSMTHSTTFEEGIHHLSHSFDAILLDLDLGSSEGLGNIRYLKKTRPDIPVIVISGNDQENINFQTIIAGAQDFLSKNDVVSSDLYNTLVSAILRSRVQFQISEKIDYITALPTAQTFHKKIRAITQSPSDHHSIICINFDNIEDLFLDYGHNAVKEFLKITADRIIETSAKTAYIARYYYNQIVVLMPSANKIAKNTLKHYCLDLNIALHKPVYLKICDDVIDAQFTVSAVANINASYTEMQIYAQMQSSIYQAQEKKSGRRITVQ